MEFFIKMITNHQCSFNRCNIIPRYSKCLNPWTLRAHIRTSWWMAYKILQVGGRTSTSNGISEMCPGDPFHFATSNRCALQSSLSFNQKDCSYCWQGHGWACWTHFGFPQCMNMVCNHCKSTTSGATFFRMMALQCTSSWSASVLPTSVVPGSRDSFSILSRSSNMHFRTYIEDMLIQ